MQHPKISLLAGIVAVALSGSSLGASTGPRFYGDPPDDHHPWAVHDGNRPQPPRVVPGTFSSPNQAGKPPSDAIILFDGSDLSQWQDDKGQPPKWVVKDGYMEVLPGSGQIQTREGFGDCQLHLEFATPAKVEGDGQGRGNSGVFLMGRLEIQVLDSYDNVTYADGHVGSYYGVNPPLVLPVRPPGEFQVYDIVFRRPIYRDNQVVDPGYVTVFLNGVLVQDHTPIEGPTGHMGRTRPRPFPEKGPLALQDHGNPTRFRNIWYRPLPPRPSEGGTDGRLTTEATMAKRAEIAAAIRADAAALRDPANPLPEMLRWFESLVYAEDAAALQRATGLAETYLKSLKSLPAPQLAGKRDEARQIRDAFRYLAKFKRVPDSFAPLVEIEQLIRDQGWDRRQR
ncbi:MAG: DUF1080 domain-containing protein [Verrucomicrobia bacterium]|nr:DUF1080 domain-containing protein [Verrucomicrobiota bacterium]